jgi:uncharacterized protein YciI
MKKFVLLAHGDVGRTPEFQQAHRDWWASLEGHVVDSGNPLVNGRDVARDGGVTELGAGSPSAIGYTIVEAESMEAAITLLTTCPMDMWVYEAVPM